LRGETRAKQAVPPFNFARLAFQLISFHRHNP
jgi:hypothetical protein